MNKNGLSGLDVLIDSHDLAMPAGTGIKSYGLQLISVLKDLGATPELLVSSRTDGNPLVATSMLYDHPHRNERDVTGWRRVLKQRIRFGSVKAMHVPPVNGHGGPVVPDSVFPHGMGCSVLFNCYRASRAIQIKTKTIATFQTAKKYRVWHATQPLSLRHKEAVQITTIHDLIPILYPHLCDELRPLFYQRVKDSLRNSRAVAVDSESTKADLLRHFTVPEEKIVVTHLYSGISRADADPRTIDMTMKVFNLEPRNYILFVGTLDSRKNVRRLVEAYLSLGSDQALVLVGKPGWAGDEELSVLTHVKKGRGQDVRQLAYVSRPMLAALYQAASCLVFPSHSEGFGLPVLEAMASGCPVVCSSTTSLPEVGGDAVEYVEPLSVESIAAGLAKVLGDNAHRQKLIERGYKRAEHFSRERFAGKIAELYARALA
ncbi:MAG TPA: glycosyltransferase family 1 protein [Chthoniobacteraceae bacterium]|nr:glycosyltransferase family 1 protein [Chthoniobacteraceae bacterium]